MYAGASGSCYLSDQAARFITKVRVKAQCVGGLAPGA